LSSDAHGHDEHQAVAQLWRKRTLMALPALGALALANVVIHMSHGHHEHDDSKPFPYEKKLLKKYPWKEGECNLFDYDCKAHHYAKATGKQSHGH
jgi:hypothetical protein